MSQNVSNGCPNACKKGNHMYNLQQVKNSKAGYAKTPKVKLGLSWCLEPCNCLTRYITHMAIKFRIKLMI